jgi:GT2 family glycosyltransferase
MVSIVVLNRNGAGLLRRLLAGLTERTDYPSLELIVVDNASSDDSLEFIRAADAPFPISILANAHNESFSDACNQGAQLAAGKLLLFLNNDVEPFEPGWLRELVACLLGSDAAAVGPVLIEPARGSVTPDRYVVHQRGLRARQKGGALVPAYRDQLADPLDEALGEDVETIAVIAACLLIGRESFERVGGFTRGYWYGPEDVDLGLKLRERGMSILCCGRSLLIHAPNSTLDAIAPDQRREWARGNRRLFAELWGPRLRREFELDRLRGSGLWADPGDSAPGITREEIEALGFCFKAAPVGGKAAASLEALAAALRHRGHRCLVLRGAEVESLAGLDYDVAVHLGGPVRYVPKQAQLNVLWSVDGVGSPTPFERFRYDIVLAGDADGSPEAVERFAERLIRASAEYATASGFRIRIEPAQQGGARLFR